MERLIDPAVMIVAMIVPALNAQGLQEIGHDGPSSRGHPRLVWRFGERSVTVKTLAAAEYQPRQKSLAGGADAHLIGSALGRPALLGEADEREVAERRHRAPLGKPHGVVPVR